MAHRLRNTRRPLSHGLPRLFTEALEPRLLLAMTLPAGFTESLVAQGLSSPTAMAFAPDGRLFVAQQNGVVRVVKNNQLLPDPFVTLANVDSSSERGLMGITFDPHFAHNGFVYLFYTSSVGARHNRVVRLSVSGDRAVPGSETLVVQLPNVPDSGVWHMGGSLTFGPDDKLYVTLGDYVNSANAQNMNVVMGKILRFNADGTIPTDNPFYNTLTGLNRSIWASGLRNPFTAAWQPGTSNYYVADVGQSSFEEINAGAPGANYGWPTTEGMFNPVTFPSFTNPVHAYGRGEGCAVIGGAFYNPNVLTFPAQYHGKFMFMDFCNGWIRTLDPATKAVAEFGTGASFPTGLSVNPVDGTVWYLSRGGQTGGHQPGLGKAYRIENSATSPAQILLQPESQTIPIGEDVTFDASATGTPPLSYQWRRNGQIIPGATSSSYTLQNVQLSDSGAQFTVTVTNNFGSDTSDPATLTVTTNTRPTPVINLPSPGTLFIGGQTINFAGSATDAEDGTLPASAFTWQIDFHHDDHVHPFYPATSGMPSGSFVVSTSGHTEHNVWYRVYLTVRDAQGLTQTTFRDIHPQTSHITLQTNIPGLTINLDGQPRTTPLTVEGVANINRVLEAPALQFFGGATYEFVSWAHGGPRIQTIPFPATDTTYIANYQPSSAVFLSDLSAAASTNGWGPFERDRSNGEQGAADGNPITLNGVNYAKGLGVHAESSITYNLAGQYTRFLSDIGLDDEVGGNGTVIFQVFADNVKIFDSGTMNGSSTTQSVDVSVAGVNQLRLVVTNGGDNINSDHADWAGARLIGPNIPYARVNFTTAGGEGYAGYVQDTGLVFGNRGNGLSYGWLQDNTLATRDRDNPNSPDERYDSFNHLQKPEYPDAVWEIAVPNGTYQVRIVAGDPNNFDGDFRINAEGVLVVNGTPTTANRWLEGAAQVNVTDGRLTIRNGINAVNNKIAFIDITTVPTPLVINGTPGSDSVQLSLSPDGRNIQVWQNTAPPNTPTFTRGLLGTTTINFTGGAGNNFLTLDLANGSPIPQGISFVGGLGDDRLTILGSSANDTVLVNGSSITINGKPVSVSNLNSIVFQGLSGDDEMILATSSPGTFEFMGGAGSDTLRLTGGTHSQVGDLLSSGTDHLVVSGSAVLDVARRLTISSLTLLDNARINMPTSGSWHVETSQLSRSGSSILNLANNALILHTVSPAMRDTAVAMIESAIRLARGPAGAWTGPGITSSTAASNPFTTLATAPNIRGPGSNLPLFTSFAGIPVTVNDVLVRFSHDGDANLDGKLGIADYLRIDRGSARSLTGFANGDFDYSGGAPDGTDYFLIDQAYLQATPMASPAGPIGAGRATQQWSTTPIRSAESNDESDDESRGLLLAVSTTVF